MAINLTPTGVANASQLTNILFADDFNAGHPFGNGAGQNNYWWMNRPFAQQFDNSNGFNSYEPQQFNASAVSLANTTPAGQGDGICALGLFAGNPPIAGTITSVPYGIPGSNAAIPPGYTGFATYPGNEFNGPGLMVYEWVAQYPPNFVGNFAAAWDVTIVGYTYERDWLEVKGLGGAGNQGQTGIGPGIDCDNIYVVSDGQNTPGNCTGPNQAQDLYTPDGSRQNSPGGLEGNASFAYRLDDQLHRFARVVFPDNSWQFWIDGVQQMWVNESNDGGYPNGTAPPRANLNPCGGGLNSSNPLMGIIFNFSLYTTAGNPPYPCYYYIDSMCVYALPGFPTSAYVGGGVAPGTTFVGGPGGAGTRPSNTSQPIISGAVGVGDTVTCSAGTWTGTLPITYTYTWYSGMSPNGTTTATYVIQAGDVGNTVGCIVTAQNSAGSAFAAAPNINPTGGAPVNTVPPALTGNKAIGDVITSSTGTWTGTTPISYLAQWMRDGSPISGQTAATYTLVTADLGHTISDTVTATNSVTSVTQASGNTITPTPGPTPTGATIYTADNAAASVGQTETNPGYTGASYAPNLLTAGDTVIFTVTAGTAGTYGGELRYNAPNGGIVTVNGVTFTLPATTSTSWAFAPFSVALASGTPTVTVAGNAGPVSVDRIDLIFQSTAVFRSRTQTATAHIGPISHIQTGMTPTAAEATSAIVTLPGAVTVGDWLTLGVVLAITGNSVTGVTGGGVSWQPVTRGTGSGDVEWWVGKASTGTTPGQPVTVTVTFSQNDLYELILDEWSGAASAGPSNVATGTGQTISFPSVTTNEPQTVVLVYTHSPIGVTPGVVGWNTLDAHVYSGTVYQSAYWELIPTNGTAISGSFQQTAAAAWEAAAMTLTAPHAGSATQTATSRIGNTHTKTQGAVAHIVTLAQRTTTQTAKGRLTETVHNAQTAKTRIQATPTKTQTAVERTQTGRLTTQTAVGRVRTTPTRTQPAVARVNTGTKTTTQTAVARVRMNVTATQTAKGRTVASPTTTQTAKSRVVAGNTRTQSALSRIQHGDTQSQTAVGRVAIPSTKTQGAVGRVQHSETITQTAKARAAAVPSLTQTATARTTRGRNTTQTSIGRVSTTGHLTQGALARLAFPFSHTQTAVGRVAHQETTTQAAKASIVALAVRTASQTATGRSLTTVTRTQTATGRVRTVAVNPQTALARVTGAYTHTQPAVVRLAVNATTTQTAKATVIAVPTRTQTATARLTETVRVTQSAVSRVGTTVTATQTATGNVLTTSPAVTQPARARLAGAHTAAIAATARVTAPGLTATQTVISRIAVLAANDQPATAAVLTGAATTITGAAQVAARVTATQSAVSTVQHIEMITTPARARIANIFGITQGCLARSQVSRSQIQHATGAVLDEFPALTQTATAQVSVRFETHQTATAHIRGQVTAHIKGRAHILAAPRDRSRHPGPLGRYL